MAEAKRTRQPARLTATFDDDSTLVLTPDLVGPTLMGNAGIVGESGRWAFAPWLRSLRTSGYRVHLAFLSLPSPDLAAARVAERMRQGGHDVPEPVVRRRFAAGLRNFLALYQGLADTWQMFDNSGPRDPRLVAAGRVGETERILDAAAWTNLRERSA
jgi:predicted ABC-type ATPase